MTNNILTKFPSELSKNVDEAKIKQLIQEANYDATNRFFEHFDPQKLDEAAFKAAAEVMNSVLIDHIKSDAWIEALCGQDVTGIVRGLLREHLTHHLTPPTIPSPAHLQIMPQTKALCISAALGALLGVLFGGIFNGISGISEVSVQALINYILCIFGAALGVYTTVFIAKNEKLQKWALPVIGGFAALDTLLQTLPMKRFIPFLSFKSYITRMLLYGVLGSVAFVACRAIKRDVPNYRREIELIVEQWLHYAEKITLIMLCDFKTPDETPQVSRNKDTSVLQKITRIVQDLRQCPSDNISTLIGDLERELETVGFTVQPTDEQLNQELDWDESLREHYTVIGIPFPGHRVKVVTLPIIRNGQIEKKGELRLLK